MQHITKETRRLQKTIGQNIHNIRRKRKLTLRKFSKLTGITVNRLDQYELGKNQINLRDLVMVSAVLDIGIAILLESNI